jgi:UDP-sulfoquinovose synthase
MKILILGGDGYLGWPTAMHLSARGHEVMVVDNYLRRRLMQETDVVPLFDVPSLDERARKWQEQTGKEITVRIGDLNDWQTMVDVVSTMLPDAIVHYAEQPSAPYSMMNRTSGMLTLSNNLTVTANLIFAVREFCPHAHIVKLGTMGEYGTPNIDIEEGWIDLQHNGRSDHFLYPRQAGSLYHTTKIMDTDLLWLYVRVWGLRVTDLMQGPVYGVMTNETDDICLRPYFNYDELFGTVINRFVVQAVSGYPLTVYGKGGQTRGYINIIDTLNCVNLCIDKPAAAGELRIFNQFVDQFDVLTLAMRVVDSAKTFGINAEIRQIENPRVEQETHYYNPKSVGLRALGLEPNPLTEHVLAGLFEAVLPYRKNVRHNQIFRGYKWK